MKRGSFALFVDEVSIYVPAFFDCTVPVLSISSKLSDLSIIFEFGSNISDLLSFQIIKSVCTNIGRRYGFVPISHILCAVNNTLVYTIQFINSNIKP